MVVKLLALSFLLPSHHTHTLISTRTISAFIPTNTELVFRIYPTQLLQHSPPTRKRFFGKYKMFVYIREKEGKRQTESDFGNWMKFPFPLHPWLFHGQVHPHAWVQARHTTCRRQGQKNACLNFQSVWKKKATRYLDFFSFRSFPPFRCFKWLQDNALSEILEEKKCVPCCDEWVLWDCLVKFPTKSVMCADNKGKWGKLREILESNLLKENTYKRWDWSWEYQSSFFCMEYQIGL